MLVYGVLADRRGLPISVRPYAGATGDPATVADHIQVLRGSCGLQRTVLFGGRGMLTDTQIETPRRNPGSGWISALHHHQIWRLATEDELEEHSFEALPGVLATRCRHQCRVSGDHKGPLLERLTAPRHLSSERLSWPARAQWTTSPDPNKPLQENELQWISLGNFDFGLGRGRTGRSGALRHAPPRDAYVANAARSDRRHGDLVPLRTSLEERGPFRCND